MGLWTFIKSKVRTKALPVGVLEGTVKWYDTTKGFGFIQSKGIPEDIFLHASDLVLKWKNYIPREGDLVWFVPKSTGKGYRATRIVILEE